ncbi:MAG: winged helix-turn-helix domain-containing protein [Flavobacteriales bacterium]|nr:winged helix-turn-helix domain-containing protein [Flavobacteriales bacterium]
MPWKPIPLEARERMERMMLPSNRPYRAGMADETLLDRALRMAMHEVLDGAEPSLAAALHGVALPDLMKSLNRFALQPDGVTVSRKRERQPDRRKLNPEQEAAIHALIRSGTPDMIGGSERLWSRESVRWLVARETGQLLPERTLSSYLERWGFAPDKPMRVMAAKHPMRMREWLKRDYPVIAMLAREADGRVGWWGRAPLLARQQGKIAPGTKPALIGSPLWEAGRFNLLFIIGNRGHARWRVHEGAHTAALAIDLLQRFLAEEPRKLFLIMPSDPLFATPEFVSWALKHKERISFHLFQHEASMRR